MTKDGADKMMTSNPELRKTGGFGKPQPINVLDETDDTS
jgi:hypothetical protein